MRTAISLVAVLGLVAVIVSAENDADARTSGDSAVRCSCASTSSCPEIGTLAIAGHKAEPVYCNQLNGSEKPGVLGQGAWYFQCVELANRWLVDGLGAPMIRGNASDLCGNADAASYVVHYRGSAHVPVPGDLLVWDGHAFGHVGVVTSVSSSSIAFANQNYGSRGVQYPFLTAPRTDGFFGSPRNDGGLRAKCVIHPRKLGGRGANVPVMPAAPASPCAGLSAANEGRYCGGSQQSGFGGGDPSRLYSCRGGTTSSVRCRETCIIEPPGRPDHCR